MAIPYLNIQNTSAFAAPMAANSALPISAPNTAECYAMPVQILPPTPPRNAKKSLTAMR